MDKKKRHYVLARIKKLILDDNWRLTSTAITNAWAHFGLLPSDVRSVILNLHQSDFYKSMTSYDRSDYWQDVYRPTVGHHMAYVKLSIVDDETVVIQFKRK